MPKDDSSSLPYLSIIVTTLNSSNVIRELLNSIESQTSLDFNLIIVDGGSIDDTVKIINSYNCVTNLEISNGIGIYEGLNLAVSMCKTKYYIVCGSDDILFPNAVEIINKSILSSADLYIFSVFMGGNLVEGNSPTLLRRIFGWQSIISSHSVGTVIKTDLHNNLGYYDSKVKILADGLFLTKVLYNNNFSKVISKEIVGKFGVDGASNKNYYNNIFTTFVIQSSFYNYYIQLILLIFRLIKYKNFLKLNND